MLQKPKTTLVQTKREMDGRKARNDISRKQQLKNYIENTDIQQFCVHTLLYHTNDGKGLPIKKGTMYNYLDDLIEKGVIQEASKQTCPDSQRKKHKHFKYVPEEDRERVVEEYNNIKRLSKKLEEKEVTNLIEKEPTQKNVFKAITSRFAIGDKFRSTKIIDLWPDDKREKVSASLFALANDKNLLGKNGKKGNENIYKLKEKDFEANVVKEKEGSDKEYECEECGKTFDSKQGLAGHLAWNHKDSEEEEVKEGEPETDEGYDMKTIKIDISGDDEAYERKRDLLVLEILKKIVE